MPELRWPGRRLAVHGVLSSPRFRRDASPDLGSAARCDFGAGCWGARRATRCYPDRCRARGSGRTLPRSAMQCEGCHGCANERDCAPAWLVSHSGAGRARRRRPGVKTLLRQALQDTDVRGRKRKLRLQGGPSPFRSGARTLPAVALVWHKVWAKPFPCSIAECRTGRAGCIAKEVVHSESSACRVLRQACAAGGIFQHRPSCWRRSRSPRRCLRR